MARRGEPVEAGRVYVDGVSVVAVAARDLRESLLTREEQRREREKPLIEAGKDTPFPGWDAVREEQKEIDPAIVLTIRDAEGRMVRRLEDGPTAQGFHRIAWDLRYPATQAIGVEGNWFAPEVQGIMAPPGQYTAELARRVDGEITQLAGPVAFEVERLHEGTLPAADPEAVVAFWRRVDDLRRQTTAVSQLLPKLDQRVAELDEARAERLLKLACSLPLQLFVTQLPGRNLPLPTDTKRFHVEHGELRRMV